MINLIGFFAATAMAVLLQIAVNWWYSTGPIWGFPPLPYQGIAIHYLTPALLFAIWVAIQTRIFNVSRPEPNRIKHWMYATGFWLLVSTPIAFYVGGLPR